MKLKLQVWWTNIKMRLVILLHVAYMKYTRCKNGFIFEIQSSDYNRTYQGLWNEKAKVFDMEIIKGLGLGTQVKMTVVEMYDFMLENTCRILNGGSNLKVTLRPVKNETEVA